MGKFLFLSGGAAVALLVVYFFDPQTSAIYPPCLFRSLTGYYCPGCGGGQALSLLLSGDFAGAFYYNPLFVTGLLGLACLVVIQCVIGMSGSKFSFWKNEKAILVLALSAATLIAIFWVWRNLPGYPFFQG